MILENYLELGKDSVKGPETNHQWVIDHYPDVYRFLRHLTRHSETAEDLAQQTFLNAFLSMSRFRSDSTMRTWLHRIAFREFIHWRRKRRLCLPLDVLTGKRDARLNDVENEIALLAALHQLPAAHREAFLLHEVQELSVEEVANVTGQKLGTVKSHLHYARKGLKELLGETYLGVTHETK